MLISWTLILCVHHVSYRNQSDQASTVAGSSDSQFRLCQGVSASTGLCSYSKLRPGLLLRLSLFFVVFVRRTPGRYQRKRGGKQPSLMARNLLFVLFVCIVCFCFCFGFGFGFGLCTLHHVTIWLFTWISYPNLHTRMHRLCVEDLGCSLDGPGVMLVASFLSESFLVEDCCPASMWKEKMSDHGGLEWAPEWNLEMKLG